ncbi:hypothetical protein LIER_27892 [Lithospermum erythrorhizon]|uniref:RNase H type-1 domain-containing protein n=1 Tax=Lithospermum erythrorhizon TaxID=34254 RepID=A0AAV3RDP7_LITER
MEYVPRERNREADRLSQLATAEYGTLPDSTTVEWVVEEAFSMKEVMDNTPEGEGGPLGPWYHAIMEFLRSIVLPEDPPKANRIQRHASIPHQPPHEMVRMLCPVPFYQWGIDVVGDLPRTPGGSGTSVPNLEGNLHPVKGFPGYWSPIIFTQFTAIKIADLCLELDIEHRTDSVSYPHSNGQVKVMNRVIFNGVKKRLQEERGCWDQELPTVLWFFQTTPSPITGETPFSLVYGSDALLPVEIHLETTRVSYYDELANE